MQKAKQLKIKLPARIDLRRSEAGSRVGKSER